MRYLTHFWFSLAMYFIITLVTGVSTVERFSLNKIFSTIFLILVFNKVPNWYDSQISIDRATGIKLSRMRHPLSHNPFIVQVYFFLLLSIRSAIGEIIGHDFYLMAVSIALIVWDSHLLLDIFTIEGIPLGLRSAISQNPHKNYSLEYFGKKSGTFSLGTKSSESEDLNKTINLISILIIVFYLFDLLIEATNDPQIILNTNQQIGLIFSLLVSQLNGVVTL